MQSQKMSERLAAADSAGASHRLIHQFSIIADAGYSISDGACILDLGCGEGDSVRVLRTAGYDAWGCDVELATTQHAREYIDAGLVRKIPMQPYVLPFEDAMFDVVLSNEVFEHVQNYPETIAELRRVMKPDAVSLHLFPPRWIPIEPHIRVPLASVIRNYTWLRFWAMLGMRNTYQSGKSAEEVARFNSEWLVKYTNYLPKKEIQFHFSRFFARVDFCEKAFLKHSKRGRPIYLLSTFLPFLPKMYGACRHRVLLAGVESDRLKSE